MTKLTPAKRLKQLKANGWLEFVEFMEAREVSPRTIITNMDHGSIHPLFLEFYRSKTAAYLAEDVCHSLYTMDNISVEPSKLLGLSAQVSGNLPVSNGTYDKLKKNNKMVKKGKYE